MNPYREQANVIKAMGHPTRLRILDILSEYEACVCHLTTVLRKPQPNVSQHLMVLRQAGLVTDRRDGVIIYYRLADERVAAIVRLTRRVLRSNGTEVAFPQVPVSPVPGCPCPKCTGAASCSF